MLDQFKGRFHFSELGWGYLGIFNIDLATLENVNCDVLLVSDRVVWNS